MSRTEREPQSEQLSADAQSLAKGIFRYVESQHSNLLTEKQKDTLIKSIPKDHFCFGVIYTLAQVALSTPFRGEDFETPESALLAVKRQLVEVEMLNNQTIRGQMLRPFFTLHALGQPEEARLVVEVKDEDGKLTPEEFWIDQIGTDENTERIGGTWRELLASGVIVRERDEGESDCHYELDPKFFSTFFYEGMPFNESDPVRARDIFNRARGNQ